MSDPSASEGEARESKLRASWLTPESRSRRLLLGLGLYLACLVVFALVASAASERLLAHTPYNHFAHLANAWIHGRQDLAGGAPAYAMNNDFAVYEGKTFISFPPFPALLMAPFVWLAGSPENFRDAQFIVWLAGIGPAGLFLVLEKIRRSGRSVRTERENLILGGLFAFGTVYFFSAVQGTVWFAAHVVGVALTAFFVLCSLEAEFPVAAGLLLGCMFLTRTTTVLLAPFFALELLRASCRAADPLSLSPANLRELWRHCDKERVFRDTLRFSAPLLCCFALASWMNHARFHDFRPWAFGHEYLTVGWQTRIQRWGLFSGHFLSRNLSVMLTTLPWRPAPHETFGPLPGPLGNVLRHALGREVGLPFQLSGHGLALWFTTPFYVWLIRPSRWSFLGWAALAGTVGPLMMNLLYQNSGWVQFGYRFSNDYAVLLFVMLAIGVRRLGRTFWIAAVWAVGWNLFGAATFEVPTYSGFYSHDPNVVSPID